MEDTPPHSCSTAPEAGAELSPNPNRRDFLRLVSAAGISAAAAPHVLAQSSAPPQRSVPATPAGVPTDPLPDYPVLPPRINPAFRQPTDGRLGHWYEVLIANIPNADLTRQAETGNNYQYGRFMADALAPLLLALRVFGDARLLGEVDRVMQVTRDALTEHEGHLAWIRRSGGTETWWHEMDDLLIHGWIAHYLYVCKVNADQPLLQPSHGERTYGDRFNWWLGYLRNHHESRWRKRQNMAAGHPVVMNFLSHPWAQNIVYHHFMEKNVAGTPFAADAPSYAAGKKMLVDQFRTTRRFNDEVQDIAIRTACDIGGHGQRYAWTWNHFTGDYSGPQPWRGGAQMYRYASHVVRMLAELAADGEYVLGGGSMPEIARTTARFLMYLPTDELRKLAENPPGNFAWANDVNGHDKELRRVHRYGTRVDGTPGMIRGEQGDSFEGNPPGREPLWRAASNYNFSITAAWADNTVAVNGETDLERMVAQSEIAHTSRPALVLLPASLVWSLGYAERVKEAAI